MKIIKYGWLIFLLTLTACFHRTIDFVDENGNCFFGKSSSGITYNYSVSCDYLHNDYVSWKSESNNEYYDALLGKMVFYIGINFENDYMLKNMKYSLENLETGEIYTEDGIYYDRKYPLVKYNSAEEFIESGKYSDNFYIAVYYDEKKLKELEKARISVYVVFEKEGKQDVVSFSKDIKRKTGITTILNKGWL